MKKNIFDTATHHLVSHKVVIGLERISEAFKSLLWEHAKRIGLSPIQIRILIFVAYHPEYLCNVSALAQEFNLTKPTISDAVRVLFLKKLIHKQTDPNDTRSYSISLSKAGEEVVNATQTFADPIQKEIEKLGDREVNELYGSLHKIIYKLNQLGVLNVQRTCAACEFYTKKHKDHFCNFLNQPILDKEIRLDCPEFQSKSAS